MKKIIKNNLLGFIMGAVIFTGVGVYAAGYLAKDISYNKNGQATVEDALNDLYSRKASTLGELLWVNSNIDSAFEPTTLNMDLTPYQSIIVMGFYHKDVKTSTGYVQVDVGSNGILKAVYNQSDIAKRSISVKTDKIEIAGGLNWEDSASNSNAIPVYIVGVK